MQFLNFKYSLEAALGPVRDLQCIYDSVKEQTLSCKWAEPEKTYGLSLSYHVNITNNGSIIWNLTTMEQTLTWNEKLIQGEIYVVSVSALTHIEGVAVETSILISDLGNIKICCLFCFIQRLLVKFHL